MGTVLLTPVVAGLSDDGKFYKISIHVAPKLDAGDLPPVFRSWPETTAKAGFKSFRLKFGKVKADGTIDDSNPKFIPGNSDAVRVNPAINADAYAAVLGNSKCTDFTKLKEMYEGGPSIANASIKSFDTQQVAQCIKKVHKSIFNQAASIVPGLKTAPAAPPPALVPLVPLAAEDRLMSLTLEHYPLSDIPGATRTSDENPLTGEGKAIFDRDSYRLTHSTHLINDNANEDLKKVAARQLNPKKRPSLDNPLVDHATYWKRIPRTPTTVDHKVGIDTPDRVFDFHERVALLGNYGSLLRDFGLVIDVTVSVEKARDIVTAFNAVTLEFDPAFKGLLGAVVPESRWVGYTDKFLASSLSKTVVNGYFNLPLTHRLEILDIDGGGHKLSNFFHSMAATRKAGTILAQLQQSDLEKTLPAPGRSVGIFLIETDRQASLKSVLDRSSSLGSDNKQVLFAEDLARGYVVDLQAESPDGKSKGWFRLCIRNESFSIAGVKEPLKKGLVEGSIKPTATEATDKLESHAGKLNELYAHEAVLRWNGKYLCIPADQSQVLESQGKNVSPGKDFGVVPEISAPTQKKKENSRSEEKEEEIVLQPPLRVLGKYGMGARVETITGDRVSFSQTPPDNLVLKPVTYFRAEPVLAPAVLFAHSHSKTEQMEELVIRSKGESGLGHEVERVLVAPAATREVAEALTTKTDLEALINGFTKLAIDNTGRLKETATDFTQAPEIPYLPDPGAREITAAFTDDIQSAVTVKRLRFYKDEPREADDEQMKTSAERKENDEERKKSQWPNATVHQLAVKPKENPKGGASVPDVAELGAFERGAGMDGNSHQLQINVPPAWTGTLKLQSGFGEHGDKYLDGMFLWNELSDSERAELNPANVLRGDHPMLCTPRYLRIVHAVQRPLKAPQLLKVESAPCPPLHTTRQMPAACIVRPIGSTAAPSIDFQFRFDRKSTGKLVVAAKWEDTADTQTGELIKQNGHSAIFDQLVKSNKEARDPVIVDNVDTLKATHDFGDTRFKLLKLTPTAISRFRDYFPHPPGEQATAAAEVEASISGAEFQVELKNSVRPPKPDILYAVPLFRWCQNTEKKPAVVHNSRRGAGLRVFVKRPLGTSGEDELLGVVISQTDEVMKAIQSGKPLAVPISNASKGATDNFVSRWGGDPVWKSNSCAGDSLGLEDWWRSDDEHAACKDEKADLSKAAGACGWNLSLQELSTGGSENETATVAVVAFKPRLDKTRNLWCCDVHFDRTPDYGTFVRLALVSYQPHSVLNCEISQVAIMDFAQLNPDRSVIVQRTKIPQRKGAEGVSVQLVGIPNPGGLLNEPNKIEVSLERKTYKDGNDLGWQRLTDAELATQLFPAAGAVPKPHMAACEQILWSGAVLPDPICRERRMVIAEYEVFEQDVPGGGKEKVKRLIYMDAFPIH